MDYATRLDLAHNHIGQVMRIADALEAIRQGLPEQISQQGLIHLEADIGRVHIRLTELEATIRGLLRTTNEEKR